MVQTELHDSRTWIIWMKRMEDERDVSWTSFFSEKLFKVDGLDRQTELYKLNRWSVQYDRLPGVLTATLFWQCRPAHWRRQ